MLIMVVCPNCKAALEVSSKAYPIEHDIAEDIFYFKCLLCGERLKLAIQVTRQ